MMPEIDKKGAERTEESGTRENSLLRFLGMILKSPTSVIVLEDRPKRLSIKGRGGSFVPFLIAQADTKALLFYDEEDDALLLKEELEFFSGREAHIFPAFRDRVFEKDDEVQRTAFLYHLITDSAFQGLYPVDALARSFVHPEACLREQRVLTFGDMVFMEDLVAFLETAGYELVPLVREHGEYARRGSIIDVFAPAYGQPARVEFLGDEILSIRFFDPLSQRSQQEVEEVRVVPFAASAERTARIVDCIEAGMVVVHYGEGHLLEALKEAEEPEKLTSTLFARLESCLVIDTSGLSDGPGTLDVEAVSNEDLRQAFRTRKSDLFPDLAAKLKDEWVVRRFVYLFGQHLRQADRLREIFRTYGVSLPILEKIAPAGKEREWGIVIGPIRRGFRVGEVIVLTEEDIVGPKKRLAKRSWGTMDEFLNSFRDLAVGDYVVHVDHGIGLYRGLHELGIGGSRKDFLLIEYLDGDKLYVPVEDFHLVQKYIAGEKHVPRLDRLGSQLWSTTKKRVKKQVEEIAGELIRIHAERQVQSGHAFPPADELFREMESRFEYEETDGQLRAIEDVLSDMESERPMDRLICGDVGFGKTEVALRASFKAITDNKQVAMLVPTTILAQQHYKNFAERLRDYPITVEMLSRFRSKNEQERTLEGLKKGSVDVVIGTHRLLQKDLAFKDLGLLVIDEEHRFGVKHKEGLKSLKKNVDVLTLSATPIPRTLNMAVTGIKDLSVINTPPLDRLAVKTMVMKFNDEPIRNGIMRELARGGQVFFMHNFIHNIGVVFDYLTQLVPGVRITVAHGQMEGRALEKAMLDFIDRKYDVLLSTNIIESGLDISNVNTIFINNAHRLGLADLYQLRGRVGRSTTQAYAYLLIPKEETLTREARLRLKIIEELTELGSGFQIANYDLEIRGAGNIVGTEQSGNINLVGFELFCAMLEEAVHKVKAEGEGEKEEVSPAISLPVDAFIPETYMENAAQKLLTYKRLARIRDDDELADMEEELKDRYGADMPGPLQNLLGIIRLRIFLARVKVLRVEYGTKKLVIHVSKDTPLNLKRILSLTRSDAKKIKLLPDGRIILHTEKRAGDLIDLTRNVLMDILAV